ncbi:MAG: hypothetical protein S4CHLAM2_01960 [Chlamydiales bacterium]|nr:hypothetical protein [Chlamydiales bacterium]
MWIVITLFACLVMAGLTRKFASYSLLNGFMSKEQADDLFSEWRKQEKSESEKNK